MNSLEDSYQDIMNKAMRGHGLTAEAVAQQAGVTLAEVNALRQDGFDAAVASKIAPVLKLHPAAFIAAGEAAWHPAPVAVPGLYQFSNTEGMAPNFFLIFHAPSRTTVAFDTGDDASEMLAAIESLGCGLTAICITHTHRDHIAALGTLQARYPQAALYVGAGEPLPSAELVEAGQVLQLGGLQLECRLTTGHSVGGITYVVQGLERPVAVVGDAMFAGSMGGGGVSWADALATNRAQIFTLPSSTVLCPGHGPMTTLAEEMLHNPFYPEFK
jgi:glyoxylase-like metal-dependent hydrolase (beta-lactamase superfamily II)